MVEQGIYQLSSSHWASSLHLVKKKDSIWKPYGDFRKTEQRNNTRQVFTSSHPRFHISSCRMYNIQ